MEQQGIMQLNIENSDDVDPVEKMLEKTGCIKLHYKVQDCIAETKDWRKCQNEVTEFRKCMNEYNNKKK